MRKSTAVSAVAAEVGAGVVHPDVFADNATAGFSSILAAMNAVGVAE
jgi:hypothetical protein